MCIGTKWQFPHYQELCWYAARHLLEQLRTSCHAPPASLLHGVRVLYNALRQWLHQVCSFRVLYAASGYRKTDSLMDAQD